MLKVIKKQDGFTLVELLAVIVILAIIAAIAVPTVGNIVSKSREKAAVNDALQIIDAAKLYVADGGSDTTITPSDLNKYLSNTSGSSTFSDVIYDTTTNTYTIDGHSDKVSTTNNNSATESQLQIWLSTNGG